MPCTMSAWNWPSKPVYRHPSSTRRLPRWNNHHKEAKMPGLLRAAAATAVVAGTAQATRNAVNRHSAEKDAKAYANAMNTAQTQVAPPPQAYAPPPPPPPAQAAPVEDPIAQLERLGALKAQGLLTEEEFNAQKAKLLGM